MVGAGVGDAVGFDVGSIVIGSIVSGAATGAATGAKTGAATGTIAIGALSAGGVVTSTGPGESLGTHSHMVIRTGKYWH